MTLISVAVIRCLKQLTELFAEKALQHRPDVYPDLWQDELGRLRVWAANIGAHQTGQSSLDHRLRDASNIRDQTLRLLGRLERAGQDLDNALEEPEIEDDFQLDEELDGKEDETELQSIYHAINDTINNLFQMSMLIRRPAQNDRFIRTKRSDAAIFEPFDRQHVESKYPNAEKTIVDRLGLAISQRRSLIRYRERHHNKLGQGLDHVIYNQSDTLSTKLSETVATEFVEASDPHTELDSHSVASETSYAQTIVHGGEGIALPPPPKESVDGTPFECPYCFLVISVTKPNSWARHVFNDIMPYVCIFSGCSTPHRLYESRREWFSHLQVEHFVTPRPDTAIECRLCTSSVQSGKQFERHVGRHLEELALFALPRCEYDQDENPLPSDVSDGTSEVGIYGSDAGNLSPTDTHIDPENTSEIDPILLNKSDHLAQAEQQDYELNLSSSELDRMKSECLRTWKFTIPEHKSGNDIETWHFKIPIRQAQNVFGRRGFLGSLRRQTGARSVVSEAPGKDSSERSFQVTGTKEQYGKVQALLLEAICKELPADDVGGRSQMPQESMPTDPQNMKDSDLEFEKRNDTSTNDNSRTCFLCALSGVENRGVMIRHIKHKHYPQYQYSCPKHGCRIKQHRKDKIRSHIRSHSGIDPNLYGQIELSCPTQCAICHCTTSSWDEFYTCIFTHQFGEQYAARVNLQKNSLNRDEGSQQHKSGFTVTSPTKADHTMAAFSSNIKPVLELPARPLTQMESRSHLRGNRQLSEPRDTGSDVLSSLGQILGDEAEEKERRTG